MSKPSVSISYSHDSEEHKDRVLSFANQLCEDGVDCFLDQYEDSPVEGWTLWMNNCINKADFVLMLCTETYYNRVMGKEKKGIGLGGKFEGKLIHTKIYKDDSNNDKYLPLLFDSNHRKFIPDILQDFNNYVISSKAGYEDLYRRITNQPKVIKPAIGKQKKLKPKSSVKSCIQPLYKPVKIEISKLPVTSPDVFGREAELEIIDNAWENSKTRILSFIAWGGVGKSALINGWLNKIADSNYKGAELVYGWSFYSQGTKEKGQASADGFFNDAFQWFGYTGEIPKTQHEKGRLLAEIISEQKTLLILDGLEPLQYPPGEMHGSLKDQTMTGLLKNLARNMNGLCIITSRCKVKDLQTTEGRLSLTQELENLSEQAGKAVLKSYSLKGTDKEFLDTSTEFQGHALALHLVGSYLNAFHEGDIRKRDLIPKLTEDEKQGGHARRVMESYEKWFAESNKAELDVLNLLGLFDRPSVKEAIDVLKKEPVVKGLTDRLQHLSNRDWQLTLNHLRELRLVAAKDNHNPDTLDCHPLIREHFGKKLEQQNPDGWKEAHARLYEYYKNKPEKELPGTLEEMEPLFAAVMHGCLAGKHQEVMVDVYWNRIKRGNEQYIDHKLGAFGADLSCLSGFFETLWDKLVSGLTAPEKEFTLGCAGFALRAVGRFSEAAQPLKVGLEMVSNNKNLKRAAVFASHLIDLYLTIGNVESAKKYGVQSVDYADRSGDGFQMESKRARYADVFHQTGKNRDAENLFIEAENMQKKRQSETPWLYGLAGFLFCDLLLSMGKYQEVLERTRTTIKKADNWLLDIAHDNLTIGKALMLQAVDNKAASFSEAEDCLNRAVDGLREVGVQDFLVRGLFARATLCRYQKDFLRSWSDLDEAGEVAEYGQMRLHLTDYHLEACRNIRSQLTNKDYQIIENGETFTLTKEEMQARFQEHFKKAERLIKETGYHRRDKELEELRNTI